MKLDSIGQLTADVRIQDFVGLERQDRQSLEGERERNTHEIIIEFFLLDLRKNGGEVSAIGDRCFRLRFRQGRFTGVLFQLEVNVQIGALLAITNEFVQHISVIPDLTSRRNHSSALFPIPRRYFATDGEGSQWIQRFLRAVRQGSDSFQELHVQLSLSGSEFQQDDIFGFRWKIRLENIVSTARRAQIDEQKRVERQIYR